MNGTQSTRRDTGIGGNHLSLFALFWAAATVSELGKWSTWRQEPLGYLTLLAAVALLIHPGSILRLGLLCGLQVLHAAARMPWLTNHTILSASISLLILALLWHAASTPRAWPSRAPDPEAVFARLAPILRNSLILVYTLATFHKLNTSWFDPETSCAVLFWNRVGSMVHLPGVFKATGPLAPWLALGIEVLLPILLSLSRARTTAILIGLIFHLFLGLVGFFRFSSLVTVLYLAFIPEGLLEVAHALFHRLLSSWEPLSRLIRALGALRFRRALTGLLAMAAIPGLLWLASQQHAPTPELVRDGIGGPSGLGGQLTQAAWALTTLGLLALLSAAIWNTRSIPFPPQPPAPSRGLLHWALPSAVIILGFAPYIGFRTQSTFSMFSNLRVTATGSNHLLFRRPTLWNPPGSDPVTILDSSDPELLRARTGNHAIPWIELCSHVQHRVRHGSDLSLTFERQRARFHIDSAKNALDTFPEATGLFRQIFCFRTVNLDPECRCSH